MSFSRSGASPPSRKRPLVASSEPWRRQPSEQQPQIRQLSPTKSSPTAVNSSPGSVNQKEARSARPKVKAASPILYDTRMMDNPKITSYFKAVEQLPVDPIAAAARLGWRNVFSLAAAEDERGKVHDFLRLTSTGKRSKKRQQDNTKIAEAETAEGSGGNPVAGAGLSREWAEQARELEGRVEELWVELHVPEHDRAHARGLYFVGAPGYDEAEARQSLMYECVSLLRHRHETLEVLRAIRERERCMVYLKAMCHRFGRRPKAFVHPTKGGRQRLLFCECLGLMRDTTLLCVEAIGRWRKHLWRNKPFLWQGEDEGGGGRGDNYMERMGSDVSAVLAGEAVARLLQAVGLSAPDLALLLVPGQQEREGKEKGNERPEQESGDVSECRQAYLSHTFEGEAEKDFTGPRLSKRLRAAVRALHREHRVAFELRLETARLKDQGLFIPLLRRLPASRLHRTLANAEAVGATDGQKAAEEAGVVLRGRVRAGRSKPGAEGQQRGRSPDELVGLRLLPAADDVPPQTTAAVKPEPIGPAEEAEGPSELQEPPPPPSSGVKEKPEGEEGSAAAPPQPAAIDADTPPAAPAADSSGDVAAVEEEQRESGDGSGRPEPLDMGQADPTPLQRDGHGYDDDDNLYISPAALSPSNSFASYAPSDQGSAGSSMGLSQHAPPAPLPLGRPPLHVVTVTAGLASEHPTAPISPLSMASDAPSAPPSPCYSQDSFEDAISKPPTITAPAKQQPVAAASPAPLSMAEEGEGEGDMDDDCSDITVTPSLHHHHHQRKGSGSGATDQPPPPTAFFALDDQPLSRSQHVPAPDTPAPPPLPSAVASASLRETGKGPTTGPPPARGSEEEEALASLGQGLYDISPTASPRGQASDKPAVEPLEPAPPASGGVEAVEAAVPVRDTTDPGVAATIVEEVQQQPPPPPEEEEEEEARVPGGGGVGGSTAMLESTVSKQQAEAAPSAAPEALAAAPEVMVEPMPSQTKEVEEAAVTASQPQAPTPLDTTSTAAAIADGGPKPQLEVEGGRANGGLSSTQDQERPVSTRTARTTLSSTQQPQQQLPPRAPISIITTTTAPLASTATDPAAARRPSLEPAPIPSEKSMVYGPSIYDLCFSPKHQDGTAASPVSSANATLASDDTVAGSSTSNRDDEEDEARSIADVDELDHGSIASAVSVVADEEVEGGGLGMSGGGEGGRAEAAGMDGSGSVVEEVVEEESQSAAMGRTTGDASRVKQVASKPQQEAAAAPTASGALAVQAGEDDAVSVPEQDLYDVQFDD